jgi:glycosyltransferase involved in cell wall biosynthesis
MVVNLVPYHHARWRAYAETGSCACTLIEITHRNAFPILEADIGKARYRRVTLFNNEPTKGLEWQRLNQAVCGALDRLAPDVVVVNGYSMRMSQAALGWCWRERIRIVVCSESNEFDEPRTFLKEAVKRRLLRPCGAGLAGGAPQAQYLTKLGLSSERVFTGYNCVESEHFTNGAEHARSQASDLRGRFGMPENYFLACGRFEPKKNHQRLIEAYARYRALYERSAPNDQSPCGPWHLVLIGDGELRPQVKQQITRLGLQYCVHLTGPKRYDELPTFYGLANAFIHPSSIEQWGLVVNEAMASGLPVLVSSRCGCAADLVQEGVNGFTFDPLDVEGLAQLMIKISAFQLFRLSAFGDASRTIIANWGPERFAAGMNAAVECALKVSPKRANVFDRLLLRALLSLG